MIAAIVPAAGKSERMGRCKLTLSIGGRPVIERVVGALRDGGVERIVVVITANSPEIHRFAEKSGADVLVLDSPTADMRETVDRGLDWHEAHIEPPPNAWLLAPADYPFISAKVVRALLEHHSKSQTQSIIVPVHAGKHGHPILIPWRHVAAIRSRPAGCGIDDYVRQAEIVEIAVADAGVLRDLDTPDEYEMSRK